MLRYVKGPLGPHTGPVYRPTPNEPSPCRYDILDMAGVTRVWTVCQYKKLLHVFYQKTVWFLRKVIAFYMFVVKTLQNEFYLQSLFTKKLYQSFKLDSELYFNKSFKREQVLPEQSVLILCILYSSLVIIWSLPHILDLSSMCLVCLHTLRANDTLLAVLRKPHAPTQLLMRCIH